VLGFIVFTAVCLHKIYDVLRWKDTTGGYLSSISQLYATDEDLMDLVFVGSSHCYQGIYPELLWEEKGIAGFDLAVSAQDRSSAYYQLKELLKTQRPKVVVVDIYGICYEEHLVESNVYRNYLSMKTSPNSLSHVLSYGEWEKQKELLARWPIIHTRYRELKEYDFLPYEPSITGRGSLITWKTYPVEADNAVNLCETIEPLNEKNREWVQDMIALSKQEDFALVFSLIPWKRGDDKQAILNGFKEYIEKEDVVFLDFTALLKELDLNPETDWADPEHLNARGAGKLTHYLGEYLSAHYELPDRRGDSRYDRWDQAWERYHQIDMLNQLSTAAYLEDYILLLTQVPRITCILNLEGAYADSASGIYTYASGFGMEYEDYLRGGKWIYRNGQLTKLCENEPGSESVYDLNDMDVLKVCFSEDFAQDNILINETPYGLTWGGLQIILYDDIEKKVVDIKDIH